MGLNSHHKVLLGKIEATYGVDPTPTGALNAVLTRNFAITPMDGKDVVRISDKPFFGDDPMLPSELKAMMTFETELIGHGTVGTAPLWGFLMRAAACAQVIVAITSVTYNPVSTGFESATFYFDMGGMRQIMKGARGTAVLATDVNGIPVIKWTFTGLWTQPTDLAPAVPVFTGFQQPYLTNDANTPTFTVNGVACLLRKFELDLGNQVAPRYLQNYEEIIISDTKAKIKLQIEALPLATLNPYALALAQTPFALNLVYGVGAGKIVTINAPSCRMGRPKHANQDNVLEWDLEMIPLAVAGNDQFRVIFT